MPCALGVHSRRSVFVGKLSHAKVLQVVGISSSERRGVGRHALAVPAALSRGPGHARRTRQAAVLRPPRLPLIKGMQG